MCKLGYDYDRGTDKYTVNLLTWLYIKTAFYKPGCNFGSISLHLMVDLQKTTIECEARYLRLFVSLQQFLCY